MPWWWVCRKEPLFFQDCLSGWSMAGTLELGFAEGCHHSGESGLHCPNSVLINGLWWTPVFLLESRILVHTRHQLPVTTLGAKSLLRFPGGQHFKCVATNCCGGIKHALCGSTGGRSWKLTPAFLWASSFPAVDFTLHPFVPGILTVSIRVESYEYF